MYSFRKSKKGFTLIELMVVVAIIGVLALLGLRLYAIQQDKAKAGIVKANAGSIQVHIQTSLVDIPLYSDANAVTDANTATTLNLRNPFTGLSTNVAAAPLATYAELIVDDADSEGMVGVYQSGTVFYIMGYGKSGVCIPDYILRAQR